MRLTFAVVAAWPLLATMAQAQTPPDQPSPPTDNVTPHSGVIRPPGGVDPGINKMPPGASTKEFPTPVLPPPGSPGGNPNVVPK